MPSDACTAAPASRRVRDNLRKLDAAGASIVLRCPVIPGLNDSDAHLREVARLAGTLRGLRGIDVLPYHPLGDGKRSRLGKAEAFAAGTPSEATVEGWITTLRALAPNVPVRQGAT